MANQSNQKVNARKNKILLGYGVAIVFFVMAVVSFFSRGRQEPDESGTTEVTETAHQLEYSGDFGYYTDDDGVVIASYEGIASEIVVPSEINGQEVYQVGDAVFSENATLAAITLPETLRVIGTAAFQSCVSLSEIVIPANVTWIGPYAFYGCTALEKVTFEQGEGDAIIGYFAFSECSALTEIVIPSNYIQLDTKSLSNCTALETFRWESNEEGNTEQDLGGFVFEGCDNLKEVHLAGVVKDIEDANGYASMGFTIYAPKDSYAIEIAKENGIDYKVEEE